VAEFCNLFFIAYAVEPLVLLKPQPSRAGRGSKFTAYDLFVVFGPVLLPLRLIVVSSVTSAGSQQASCTYLEYCYYNPPNVIGGFCTVADGEYSCGEFSSTKTEKRRDACPFLMICFCLRGKLIQKIRLKQYED